MGKDRVSNVQNITTKPPRIYFQIKTRNLPNLQSSAYILALMFSEMSTIAWLGLSAGRGVIPSNSCRVPTNGLLVSSKKEVQREKNKVAEEGRVHESNVEIYVYMFTSLQLHTESLSSTDT